MVSCLAGRAAAQVGQVVHAALLRHRTQPLPRDREEPAQQPAAAPLELLQPRLPAIRTAADPLQDLGHLVRDRRFPLAKQPPGVVHQQQVIAQREALDHPLAR